MKDIRLLIVLALFLIVPSCINKKGQGGSSFGESAVTINIPVLKDTIIKLSDFCSRVDYIPFESTLHSTLGQISDISISSQGEFIVFDRMADKLLRFGSSGNFINQIGIKGHQINEYTQICDYAYDPYENQIIIWDGGRHVLLYYALDGQVLNRSEVSPEISSGGNFDVLDENHLVFSVFRFSKRNIGKPLSYSYVVTSKDGKDAVVEYEDPSSIFMSTTVQPHSLMSDGNNAVLGHSRFSPDVFRITSDSFNSFYHFSFADKTITYEWKDYSERDFGRMLSTPGITYCVNFFVAEKHYIMTLSKGPLHLYVQERAGSAAGYSGFIVVNDMFRERTLDMSMWVTVGLPLYAEDNNCYFVLDPAWLSSERITELRGKALSEGNGLEKNSQTLEVLDEYKQMAENDNLVLVKCTLK